MKLRSIALGLTLLSTSVLAQDYQVQINGDYVDYDGRNTFSVRGTYHFDKVSTKDTAWAEAAFMGQKSNVKAAITDFDGDATSYLLGGEWFADNNFYAALNMNYVDADGGYNDTTFTGEVGYFFADNWLVAITGNDDDFSDTLGIRTKYIHRLADSQFINFEAAYSDATDDFTVAGDFYWSPQSSVGLVLSDADEYRYGIRAQHFFTPAIALRLTFSDTKYDDIVSIGLTGRF